MILSRKMLKNVGDKRHYCLTCLTYIDKTTQKAQIQCNMRTFIHGIPNGNNNIQAFCHIIYQFSKIFCLQLSFKK